MESFSNSRLHYGDVGVAVRYRKDMRRDLERQRLAMNDNAYTGPHDTVSAPCHQDRIVPLSTQEAAKMLDEAAGIMDRARACLNRFTGRYAESAHAKGQVKEGRLIVQEIDEWLLRR